VPNFNIGSSTDLTD